VKRPRRCLFSVVAARDLEDIGDYIARDNPERALSFVRKIQEQCRKITAYPEAAPLRPELGEGIRMVPFGRYLIFYTVHDDHVRIERILHGSRNILDLFEI
jgi:toxin ParE1/3/4